MKLTLTIRFDTRVEQNQETTVRKDCENANGREICLNERQRNVFVCSEKCSVVLRKIFKFI